MQRKQYIELVRRQIYGGQPNDDAEITPNLVNKYLDFGVAFAAQKNYIDNNRLEGVSFVNNSFYTTFKSLEIESDEQFLWKIELPQIPVGIGANEGVSTIKLKDNESNQLTFPFIPLTMNQTTYNRGMRPIPNKTLYYSEGKNLFILSTLLLSDYTAQVTMISGGNSADMDSEYNVPPDYIPFIGDYIKKELMFERLSPVDEKADGLDSVKNV